MDGPLRRTSFLQILVTFFLLLLGLNIIREVDSLGINYGQVANNLPPPEKVLQLLHALKITKARIYDTNPQVLTALANSNIELIVTVENQMLATLGDQQQALQWVTTHIRPYFPATNITGIAVGNEIFTDEDTSLMTYLVPAMVNIHSALIKTGLSQYIQVSSPNSLAVLANSYPPSAGNFRSDLNGIMQQFLQFLVTTRAPFWINAYPYFAYKDNPNKISLDYVLFNSNQGMIDPYTRLHYDNMLYAQVDAAIFAIARMGFNGLEVKISETGWPSKGDPNEIGATFQNAAIYNRNILRRQLLNEGTPLRPNVRLDIYVFALFNEDQKPGPTSERNYGLFQPDGTMAYNVGLLSTTSTTTSSTNSEPASASIFLTSSAPPMVKQVRYQSLANWMMFAYFCWLCKG
ncbi:glucan endo-1,3-beta-glucosidase 11 [Nicotiana tabacum]|uniref:glucan endo-1,3-beta-D-glucosidase n=1 Tax=Nicotiana tabacum TaxID=4097 RepID=A0A1S4B052_TOBAC|nr:glucan endo-1,3-beta-glucosidase 11-like [Nicotiana tomentosiformis]XP_016482201.1 PREDICTED: glucan endo-1,3-beta-glucosidase 11-like [Nicotiana tabacum]